MRRGVTFLTILGAMAVGLLSPLGVVQGQGERPPQPFFQDFYSGTVTLLGSPAPSGSQLIACVHDCESGFQSQPTEIGSGGSYRLLEVNPSDEALIGLPISFYLVNEFGRIKAVESRNFVGVFDFYELDLTFNDSLPVSTPIPTATPLPTLTPTAVLPGPGDAGVTAIPRLALIMGAGAVAAGGGLILLARRRVDS